MHRLEANLALPHALEPALLLLLGAVGALPAAAALLEALREALALRAEGLASRRAKGGRAECRPGGAEDGACGGGGHSGIDATSRSGRMWTNVSGRWLATNGQDRIPELDGVTGKTAGANVRSV